MQVDNCQIDLSILSLDCEIEWFSVLSIPLIRYVHTGSGNMQSCLLSILILYGGKIMKAPSRHFSLNTQLGHSLECVFDLYIVLILHASDKYNGFVHVA